MSGKITSGQVIVDVGEDNTITLNLDGVEISSQTSSPILIKSGKATINLLDGSENYLADETYSEDADENATLYAKEDLTITGNGTLTIQANGNDGLTSKDDLLIKGGNLIVNAVDDGIRGKNSLTIEDGQITVTAGGDGLKSDDEEDGNILINSGSITISAGSDGIDAYNSITINNGTINILKSEEGIESELITINGGDISIFASDDGINISDSSSSSSEGMMHRNGTASGRKLIINGGVVIVNADGDGLDSNGAIEMNGGEVYVFGPTNDGNGALDYDEEFQINGGVLLAFGSAGMAENVSTSSTQNSVLLGLASQQTADTTFKLTDTSGAVLSEIAVSKAWSTVVISAPYLQQNQQYTYSLNNQSAGDFTLTQTVSQAGTITRGGFG